MTGAEPENLKREPADLPVSNMRYLTIIPRARMGSESIAHEDS